ncbi:NTP transferase domain-containing protein [Tanticharoenia sakaeratensis]|uniref:NTP transferase domain-containing protein n=1 Tax=Tanticharoenia sakaeratensis TaxID=444053 RepID=UPI001F51747A|nr:NTP transferase domain-containing protein [Tanticharoenia sakaeratensis]
MAADGPLYGLVLAGGASLRMGADKAALTYLGRPQLARAYDALISVVDHAFISVRREQADDPLRAAYPQIIDTLADAGPAAGLLAAHRAFADVALLVVACDMPRLDAATLAALVAARDHQSSVTAYQSPHDGRPEPFCAIWEPAALRRLQDLAAEGHFGPRRAMLATDTRLIVPADPGRLDNINTPSERARVCDGSHES